jgi:hypothetical protein
MAFASTQPPKYDCEIFNEIQNLNLANSKDDKSSLIGKRSDYIDYSDKFLVFVRISILNLLRDFQKAQ